MKHRYRLATIAVILFWGWVTPSAFVFLSGTPRWPAGQIVMHLQAGSSTPGLFDGSVSWNESAVAALADWNAQIVSSFFSVVKGSTIPIADGDGKNSVYFNDSVFGRSLADALAVTTRWQTGNTRTEGDVIFNTAYKWNSYRGDLVAAEGGGTLYDFRRVALHEFGHVLGLDHPNQYGQDVLAIMNSRVSDVDRLQSDDIAGVRALYPSGTCSFGLAAAGASAPAFSAVGTVGVIAPPGCGWTAINNSPGMLAITAGSSGSGSGPVTFQVFANLSPTPRAGTLTIAGITFTVTQAGNCTYALSASGTNAFAAAAAGTVNVIATAGCPWSAVTNSSSMVTITEGNGTGNGVVRFIVSANTSPNLRVGSLTVAGLTFTITQAARVPATPSDVDGDGKSELVVWRPGTGMWYSLNSSLGYSRSRAGEVRFGGLGDTPLMGDMDGDGRDDLVVWRGNTGTFYWTKSSTGNASVGTQQLGHESVGDIPMLADIDGDTRADLVVWRPSTGVWYWLTSSSGYTAMSSAPFGIAGDVPMLSDMDGDGRADLIVWRGSVGTFYWVKSSNNQVMSKQWGIQSEGDVPLVGDLDGDGKGDLVVWRGPTGEWYCLTSTTGHNGSFPLVRTWGSQSTGDVPSLADRDGDGKADITVWRVSTGTWYWLQSTTGFTSGLGMQWGIPTDVPIVK